MKIFYSKFDSFYEKIIDDDVFLLSICIPTFNREKSLARLLGLLRPVCENFNVEIVVSDNASIDGTGSLCREYKEKFDNFEYYRNKVNVGFSKNLVKVLTLARGRYLWMLGDDDVVSDNAIEEIFFIIRNSRSSLIVCNFEKISFGSEKIKNSPELSLNKNLFDLNINDALLVTGVWASFMSINIVSREMFQSWIDNYDDEVCSDYVGFDLSLYAGLYGGVSIIKEPVVGRINMPLHLHRFNKIETYAFDFFIPLDKLVFLKGVKKSIRNKLANKMFRSIIGYLILKAKYGFLELPALSILMKVHGKNIMFWLLIFPLIFPEFHF